MIAAAAVAVVLGFEVAIGATTSEEKTKACSVCVLICWAGSLNHVVDVAEEGGRMDRRSRRMRSR